MRHCQKLLARSSWLLAVMISSTCACVCGGTGHGTRHGDAAICGHGGGAGRRWAGVVARLAGIEPGDERARELRAALAAQLEADRIAVRCRHGFSRAF